MDVAMFASLIESLKMQEVKERDGVSTLNRETASRIHKANVWHIEAFMAEAPSGNGVSIQLDLDGCNATNKLTFDVVYSHMVDGTYCYSSYHKVTVRASFSGVEVNVETDSSKSGPGVSLMGTESLEEYEGALPMVEDMIAESIEQWITKGVYIDPEGWKK